MVLSHLMLNADIYFAIVHVNFGLRGDDADADEKFVADFARQNDLVYYVKKVNTKEYASEKGISIEMAARELRYTFFDELMRSHNYDYLLTAHHFNDDIETLLIKLGRGSTFGSV